MDFKKNKLRELQEKRRKQREEVKKFSDSKEGQALLKKVRDKHTKQTIDPKDLPF